MGLFGMFKPKESKQKTEEDKKARAAQLVTEADQLRGYGQLAEAESRYKEAAELSAWGAINCAEALKEWQKWEDLFKVCDKASHLYYKEPLFNKLLAECYRYGRGTQKDRPKACKCAESYQFHCTEEEKLDAILFKLETARELMGDVNKALQLSFEKLKELKQAKNPPANLDAVKIASNWTLEKIKWDGKISGYRAEAARAGHIPSLKVKLNDSIIENAYEYGMLAADMGEYWGTAWVFWRLLHSGHIVKDVHDLKPIVQKLELGAEAGDVNCMFALAVCYADDLVHSFAGEVSAKCLYSPYKPDGQKFFDWLLKAYEAGSKEPGVLTLMAQYYAMGKIWTAADYRGEPVYVQSVRDIDQAKAIELLEEAVEEREKITSKISIGMDWNVHYWTYRLCKDLLTIMYFDGFGTKADVHKAFKALYGSESEDENPELRVLSETRAVMMELRENLAAAEGIEDKMRRCGFGDLGKVE